MKTETAALQTAHFELKASQKRQFTGLASTWDLDFGGDLIVPGAYRRTLSEIKAEARKIPLINQHNYYDARQAIGKMLEAEETDDGLEATFQIVASAEGDEFLARIREGIIDGLSIGYETRAWREPTEKEKLRGVQRVITDVELREISLVIWGMNASALIDTSSVKTIASTIASMKRETLTDDDKKMLRQVASLSGALLRPLPPPEQADAELKADAPDTPEAPPGEDTADAQKAKADTPISDEEKALLRDALLAFQFNQTIHRSITQ